MKNIIKKVAGVIIAFVIVGTIPKVVYFITLFIASPFANSERAIRDIEAVGNILGLFVAIFIAFRAYRLITKTKKLKSE